MASLILRKLAQGSRACNCCPITDSFPVQSTESVLEQKHHTTIANPQTSTAEGDVGSRTLSAKLSGSCLPLLPVIFMGTMVIRLLLLEARIPQRSEFTPRRCLLESWPPPLAVLCPSRKGSWELNVSLMHESCFT